MRKIFAVIFVGACLVLPKFAVSEEVTHTLRCESEEFSPRKCQLPLAPRGSEIKEIRKIKQLSTKPCFEGQSWVADESGITVRNGCRAEFLIVYRISNHSDRRERWHDQSDSNRRQERSDDRERDFSPQVTEDPTDIVLRSFEDIFNRRPSREEVRFYRNLMIDQGWTERQLRNELRHRNNSGNRY